MSHMNVHSSKYKVQIHWIGKVFQ